MKKIVLTGGGTAGHVTPNIALLPALQAAGYEISYVGSYEGIEKKLIADFNIPYTGISTGKFRRYLDPKNFSDPFRVMKGFVEARNYLKNYQPDVVFSKGGFVSVPVVRTCSVKGYYSRNCRLCLCQRSGRLRRGHLRRARGDARERHHAGAGEQAVHSRCGKGMLQFPGDHEKHSGRQSRPYRFSHPRRTGRRQ